MAAERRRVLGGGAMREVLCLARLHKRYGPPGTKVRAPLPPSALPKATRHY